MRVDVTEGEGKGKHLESPTHDLAGRERNRSIGEPTKMTSGVRETEAVTDDGAEARTDTE